jgi:hypothetical protein
MTDEQRDLAMHLELHEAKVWAACVAAAAEISGNPLKAEVDSRCGSALVTLAALNFGHFNRVIALGVNTPATDEDLESVKSFYSSRSQSRFTVEVTPASQPPDLAELLTRHGLQKSGVRVAKCWRTVDDFVSTRIEPEVDVQLLSVEHLDAFNAVSVAAWGTSKALGVWFGATLGREGFRHYGIFDGDELVSTCAMFISDDIAWTGFAATKPQYQRRGFQKARIVREMIDAAALGCRGIHNEADVDGSGISLRNIVRAGFQHLYTKDTYASFG